MAYQFFRSQQQPKTPTSPPQVPSSSLNSSRNTKPPIHPPPVILPGSSSSSSTPPTTVDTAFRPAPYPQPIEPGYPTPHPHITIDPVRTAHIPSLSRITGLLLPIRYPSSFYTATITDPVIASLSRVAVYHGHPVAAAPERASITGRDDTVSGTGTDKVIGGIRCRLERQVQQTTGSDEKKWNDPREPTNLYIQTLHLLSPHRGHGVAASLLNSLLFSTPPSSGVRPPYRVSGLVKHYNIRSVTAHVHEANDEGLHWYVARGFKVEDGVVEGYYRRLNPTGARIVRLELDWEDDEYIQTKEEGRNESTTSSSAQQEVDAGEKERDDGDDDWEKVEAEDGDDQEDHGIENFGDSHILDPEELPNRKRKADSDLHA
ncbi:hypothetical protein DTO271D3_7545 [Paecilomyces variotii]|nr:hypothetical protein DTO169C6_7246 [Paecilomyces variotii]KAJ9228812.1 hypothetical protein DTO169E5_9059 [Paecilomyces variotii]KAJ9264192.1 hypothetical protein DTO212C5_7251 [Paecilomyces variotii]KAJ9312244.1 hypothetical protein DTO271D3_7545 [Paecilomyces variotii]